MATSKIKVVKNQRTKPRRPRIRLIHAAGFLFVAACIAFVLELYGLSSMTNLYSPPHHNSNEERSESHALFDDLTEAVKPFNSQGFNLQQIFDDGPVWGSLNSGHYFGMRLTSPDSIETSLMWFKNQLNHEGRLNIRHLCDQNDKLDFYSWLKHDFHSFGQQVIEDDGLIIHTSYIKDPNNKHNWQAQVKIESSPSNKRQVSYSSVIQYVSTNHPDDRIELIKQSSRNERPFKVRGYSRDVGTFYMTIDVDSDSRNLVKDSHLVGEYDKFRLPASTYIHSRILVKSHNGSQIFILPGSSKIKDQDQDDLQNPNIIAYQMIVKAPTTFTIKWSDSDPDDPGIVGSVEYESRLHEKVREFDERFTRTFSLSSQDNNEKNITERLAQVALSNMIGSIGYFHGVSFVGSSTNMQKVAQYGPIQLLTGVPSRSFFPRGFLWDEGFHNLVISEWDTGLSNKIIMSWFDIMNVNGWIPREVILGVESMRRVPQEFIIQRIANANPPSMFIVIERMLSRQTLENSTFESIYPKLKTWYRWFNTTQAGDKPSTFRWRGRDELSVNMLNPKTLTSGLDDYPRATHPSPLEYHIDLRCWMALAARTLSKLADRKGELAFRDEIQREAHTLTDNNLLNELHWNDDKQMYCDYGHNTETTELVKVTKTRRSKYNPDQMETYQVLERHSTGHPVFGCVPEFGYVSLFPMLTTILDPRGEKLGITLDRLHDENELWSPYGVRSLSKRSRYYRKYNTEHDKPYWRGAIWLNMNYLILSSLEYYSKQDGPYRFKCSTMFAELKDNLVSNVLGEFERTKYIWENYDDLTGKGQGSHPFTGWSSLILLIMSSNLR